MSVVINRIDDKSGPPVFTVVHGKRQRAFVSLRDALAVSEVLLSPGAGESALTTPELKADFRALADIDKRISRDPDIKPRHDAITGSLGEIEGVIDSLGVAAIDYASLSYQGTGEVYDLKSRTLNDLRSEIREFENMFRPGARMRLELHRVGA